jgi:hypothetical protein
MWRRGALLAWPWLSLGVQARRIRPSAVLSRSCSCGNTLLLRVLRFVGCAARRLSTALRRAFVSVCAVGRGWPCAGAPRSSIAQPARRSLAGSRLRAYCLRHCYCARWRAVRPGYHYHWSSTAASANAYCTVKLI